ncbi:MAG: GNAT family N-acetyltransferase [Candidatus Nanoarchaeia archaeon]
MEDSGKRIDYKIRELTAEYLSHHNCTFYLTLSNLKESPELEIEKSRSLLERINSQDGHVFVAINEDYGIIGSTKIMIEQKLLRGGVKAGHIEDVATRKGFCGIGVAKNLVKRAIDFSRENQCYKIVLDCGEELKDFYKNLGFENAGDFMRMYF